MKITKVEMYTIPNCQSCTLAKELLKEYSPENVIIHTMGVDGMHPSITQEHVDKVNPSHGQISTVPQIFINEEHVGGFTELQEFLKEKL